MITQERLKELLHYDPDTGVFTWKESRGGVSIGGSAGTLNQYGYISILIDRRSYLAHRLVWLYVHGEFPVNSIDHINHVKLDNRMENLRDANESVNSMNRPMQKNNKSGHTGVHWHKGNKKWFASIKVDRKSIGLGLYVELSDAVKARKDAEKKYKFHENHGI